MEILESHSNPLGAVLVIHSWWGLTESFRQYGENLARSGFHVGLADLFSGETASTERDARRLRSRRRAEPMYKTLGGNIEDLRKASRASATRLGVVGFSMGGHWAVWLSQRPEYRVSSTILYYATRGGDFSKCTSSFQAHFAENDPWVSKNARRTMERDLTKAGCDYEAFDYPGTSHWFAETSRKKEFDLRAASIAFERDVLHLKSELAEL